jgi:hypothetical protein
MPNISDNIRSIRWRRIIVPFGDLPSLRGQADVPFLFYGDKPILLQSLQGKRHRGSGQGEPMGKRRGYHGLPLSFRFRNGFQIIFFGDRDHGRVRTPPNACSLTLPLRRFVSVWQWRRTNSGLLHQTSDGCGVDCDRHFLPEARVFLPDPNHTGEEGASGERCREGQALISC